MKDIKSQIFDLIKNKKYLVLIISVVILLVSISFLLLIISNNAKSNSQLENSVKHNVDSSKESDISEGDTEENTEFENNEQETITFNFNLVSGTDSEKKVLYSFIQKISPEYDNTWYIYNLSFQRYLNTFNTYKNFVLFPSVNKGYVTFINIDTGVQFDFDVAKILCENSDVDTKFCKEEIKYVVAENYIYVWFWFVHGTSDISVLRIDISNIDDYDYDIFVISNPELGEYSDNGAIVENIFVHNNYLLLEIIDDYEGSFLASYRYDTEKEEGEIFYISEDHCLWGEGNTCNEKNNNGSWTYMTDDYLYYTKVDYIELGLYYPEYIDYLHYKLIRKNIASGKEIIVKSWKEGVTDLHFVDDETIIYIADKKVYIEDIKNNVIKYQIDVDFALEDEDIIIESYKDVLIVSSQTRRYWDDLESKEIRYVEKQYDFLTNQWVEVVDVEDACILDKYWECFDLIIREKNEEMALIGSRYYFEMVEEEMAINE